MIQLLNGSRFGHELNLIYVQGNYLEWYNNDMDCLEDTKEPCPLVFINVELLEIDEDGLWLELPENWENNNTWKIYEKSITSNCYNLINNEILEKGFDNDEKKRI